MRHLARPALFASLLLLGACASAPEEPFDASSFLPPEPPSGPGAFYTFMNEPGHVSKLKVATRTFTTGAEGEQDTVQPQENLLCAIAESFEIDGGRVNVINCVGYEHGRIVNGAWLVTPAGLWRLDETPAPNASAASLAQGKPWIAAEPAEELETVNGVTRAVTAEPAYHGWCVTQTTSEPLEEETICLRHDGFLSLRERRELSDNTTRITEGVYFDSIHDPKP